MISFTRGRLALLFVALCAGCAATPQRTGTYLFVWAGDKDKKASDFLGVIDADPASSQYGAAVASVATGTVGSSPHHTEHEMPPSGHLLANGFGAGRTWLFDLTAPSQPKVMTSFGELEGFSHPHTYMRLSNGHVLTTFQYRSGTSTSPHTHGGQAPADAAVPETGGLVELDETGRPVRSRSAVDPAIDDRYIYPYSALPIPALDRVVSTTTDMNEGNKLAKSPWVQIWRLSDLTLIKSFSLPPGPRGDEQNFTGEPRLLPDGRGVYVHTFNCGLYYVTGVDTDTPTATLATSFTGANCGVGILTSHYWLQTVPETHSVVALDITDPAHPRDVASVNLGADEQPHWAAIDSSGRRVVVNSSGGGDGNRLFLITFDPADGSLAIDERFRGAGSDRPGVRLTGLAWPHGFSGTTVPHGTVFSR